MKMQIGSRESTKMIMIVTVFLQRIPVAADLVGCHQKALFSGLRGVKVVLASRR